MVTMVGRMRPAFGSRKTLFGRDLHGIKRGLFWQRN
jgi:hypothetical protein